MLKITVQFATVPVLDKNQAFSSNVDTCFILHVSKDRSKSNGTDHVLFSTICHVQSAKKQLVLHTIHN